MFKAVLCGPHGRCGRFGTAPVLADVEG